MSLPLLHSSLPSSRDRRGDGAHLQSGAEKRSHSSLSARTDVRTTAAPARSRKRDTDIETDEGFDSDATIDIDEGLLSPALEGAPPLQRMSSEYERVVLGFLRSGKATAFACACSVAPDKRGGGGWQHIEWAADNASSESSSDYESSSDDENEDPLPEVRHPRPAMHAQASVSYFLRSVRSTLLNCFIDRFTSRKMRNTGDISSEMRGEHWHVQVSNSR